MLDEYNVHAKTFRMARDRLQDVQVNNIKLKLIAYREKHGRTYNVPTVPEVAALIVGDFDANSKRDIIIETQHGQLQRIHELHSSYLPLQYPLLFPYGENGYRPDILHSSRSDEIPSQQDDLELYSLVKNHMVHGPCGSLNPGSPCMKKGKCSRFYPKMFQLHTILDADGFPVYRRRNNGNAIEKNGVIVDNIKPAVERLHFHLPGQHSVLYEDHDHIDDVLSRPSISDSKFISWMNTNQNSVEGRNLTYAEFVSKFVYNQKKRCWHLRKKGYTIGRLLWVPPITGELFYLRMMLSICKGPTSFEDLRTVDNVQYSTYKEACFDMGFLQDDKEFIEAIKEAKDWGSAHYIRKLFVLLLLSATMSKPEQVWDQTWHWIADDIVYNYKKSSTSPALQLDDRTLQNLVLLEIEQLLQANQRSLRDYPSMPYPEDVNCPAYLDNSLILAELNYNNEELRSEFEHLFSHMTDEQASIYNQIVEAVNKDEGGMFFLYGYGGTGKTYIWKTLASSLRADNKIVIMMASSGIASLLLPGGRTAHSKFKIPVLVFEDSTCNIHQGTQLAELLNQTSLIIWDEAPMAHKFCFEALDHSLRDIIKHNSKDNTIFGGKVMVFGGDFRQILPVIPRGSRNNSKLLSY
ncbi:ATP-dependent DNA helicase pif1 [Glycine soja]